MQQAPTACESRAAGAEQRPARRRMDPGSGAGVTAGSGTGVTARAGPGGLRTVAPDSIRGPFQFGQGFTRHRRP